MVPESSVHGWGVRHYHFHRGPNQNQPSLSPNLAGLASARHYRRIPDFQVKVGCPTLEMVVLGP